MFGLFARARGSEGRASIFDFASAIAARLDSRLAGSFAIDFPSGIFCASARLASPQQLLLYALQLLLNLLRMLVVTQ